MCLRCVQVNTFERRVIIHTQQSNIRPHAVRVQGETSFIQIYTIYNIYLLNTLKYMLEWLLCTCLCVCCLCVYARTMRCVDDARQNDHCATYLLIEYIGMRIYVSFLFIDFKFYALVDALKIFILFIYACVNRAHNLINIDFWRTARSESLISHLNMVQAQNEGCAHKLKINAQLIKINMQRARKRNSFESFKIN